jgi:hypothetical protein
MNVEKKKERQVKGMELWQGVAKVKERRSLLIARAKKHGLRGCAGGCGN